MACPSSPGPVAHANQLPAPCPLTRLLVPRMHVRTQTTWNKVFVVRAVYELGFNVIHADADVTWFRDPLDYFRRVGGPGMPMRAHRGFLEGPV